MLQQICDAIEGTFAIFFIFLDVMTNIGLLLSYALQQMFGFLLGVLTGVGHFGSTFFEELKRFADEIDSQYSSSANALHNACVNSVSGTLRSVNQISTNINTFADGTRNSIFNVFQTIVNSFTWTLAGISEIAILIGDSVWMLIMLLPNILIFCSMKLAIMVAAFFNGIVAAIKSSALMLLDGVASFVYFFTAMPIQSLLGLLSIGIAIKYRRISLQASWVVLQLHIIIITFIVAQILRILLVFFQPIEFVFNKVLSLLQLQSRSGYILDPINERGSDQESSASGKDDNGNLCVICQDRQKSVVLLPCRHLCLCQSCSTHLKRYRAACPLCRKAFREAIQVYV